MLLKDGPNLYAPNGEGVSPTHGANKVDCISSGRQPEDHGATAAVLLLCEAGRLHTAVRAVISQDSRNSCKIVDLCDLSR